MDGIGNGFKAITHVDDIIQGERDFDEMMQDLEGVLTLGAVGSGNSAAAASAAHIARDLVKVVKNMVGAE
jgi:predicted PilT family ATPase